MPLPSGGRIGPYQVVGPLGAGGMGEVYRATDTNLKRQVALKVMSSVRRQAQDGREFDHRDGTTRPR